MPLSEEQNRIEELKKSLYSRSAPDVRTRRKLRFSDANSNIRTNWEDKEEEEIIHPVLNQEYKDPVMPFLKKLLIASVAFFVIAIGIGAYIFFNGSNFISANNIEIDIDGPVSISAGEPVYFDIQVLNRNTTDLQLVDLSVEFPDGATDIDRPEQELRTYRSMIGDLARDRSAKKTVGAIIFGEENSQKEIVASLSYGVKGSSAVFTKTQSYKVLISSAPVAVSVSANKEVSSGQEFDIAVKVKSNSPKMLKNVLLRASYPFGFTYDSSDLKALPDNSTWKIGDIPPGGERTITIRGKMQGEDSDERVFRFTIGAQASNNPSAIGTEYTTVEQVVVVQKPFISVAISIDGDKPYAGDAAASFNQSERVQISWFNNLPTAVSNLQIVAKLSGSAYDKTAVMPDMGYFRSLTDEIIWNQQTTPELAMVEAGGSGTLSFTIVPKDMSTATNKTVNPVLSIGVSVSGNRNQESAVPESLSGIASRSIRVSSNISLTGRVLRTVGAFTNSGPIPPRVYETSTYTIVWTVDNTANAVSGAKVVSSLPPYVKWLGNISPSDEAIVYDQNSGTVTWDIGNINTYTSGSNRRREVQFQVSLLPSINQVDQTPTLLNQSVLTATDKFTGALLKSSQDYLNTRFGTDPAYKEGQGIVVK